jgi:hypothetical protein
MHPNVAATKLDYGSIARMFQGVEKLLKMLLPIGVKKGMAS